MSVLPKRRLTPDEYLARERLADVRSEYFRGEVFVMAGGTRHHNRVKENLAGELFARLKGSPCQSFSSDQRVKVSATGLFTYPDVVIVCGKPEYAPEDANTLINPVAVIEVLSDSTESYDRGAKFRNYQQVMSLREYVLVSQNEPIVERYVRQPDNDWLLTTTTGLEGTFAFASLPIQLPMADIFRDVDLTGASSENV